MKFLAAAIVVFCGAVLARAAQLTPEEEDRIFDNWLRKHKIKVPHTEAYQKWKANVIKQLNEAEAHNENFRNGKVGFERVLNHMAHMTPEELKASRHGVKIPENYSHPPEKVAPVESRAKRAAIPDYWNWADKGIVHAPQEQQCSDCYSFATTGAIEAHACRFKGQCTKLSEQESLECANQCNGGWDVQIYEYSLKNGGLTRQSDHEYTVPKLSQCATDINNNPRAKNTKVVDWKIMPNDTYTIMHHLYNQGPMFVTIDVYNSFYYLGSGVYDNPDGKPVDFHAILLVGYGTDPTYGDYWIIRNSWGDWWGVNGYGKIKRGKDLLRIESCKVSYPIIGE